MDGRKKGKNIDETKKYERKEGQKSEINERVKIYKKCKRNEGRN